ncbi:MAG: hypothetical protein AB8B72_06170 [Crocinitomicaceae bacterium]
MKLFNNKGYVKGYLRATSHDFGSKEFHFESHKIGDVYEKAERLNYEVVEDYEIGYDYPAHITNAIISINTSDLSDNSIAFLIESLASLFVTHLVILATDLTDLQQVKKLLAALELIDLESITFCFNYAEEYHSDEFAEPFINASFVFKTLVFNSPFDKNYEDKFFFFQRSFDITMYKKNTEFHTNLTLFSESQLYHTYFHKKLFIDSNGDIKNAPEANEVYGNIKKIKHSEDIKNIISTSSFQRYWKAHKDITDVCKDCEFRHMCVDNRVPIARSKNEWFHIVECNYNPYIAKWKGEKGYRSLEECGVLSNEEGFQIDDKKIARINTEFVSE